jgi:hypothetical protein
MGGITAKELASLELEFLLLINYRLLVSPKEFKHYLEGIKNRYKQHRKALKYKP